MKKRKITEEVSEIIWQHVWNNALPEDNDEELIREHTRFCGYYETDPKLFDSFISIN